LRTIQTTALSVGKWALLASILAAISAGQPRPTIPKAWEPDALKAMTLPVMGLKEAIKYPPADWYYRIPERQIYRGYPVYEPRKEPRGYMEWLTHQDPEIAFDPRKLTNEFDWIQAGESVFSSAKLDGFLTPDDLHNPDAWEKFRFVAAEDGSLPGWRYVIRKRGLIEVGRTLCGSCHERVVEGATVSGAPATTPMGVQTAYLIRRALNAAPSWDAAAAKEVARQTILFSVPWLTPDPADKLAAMPGNRMLAAYEALPGGVVASTGTSPFFPPKIPDLIGIKDRTYLGATGTHRHLGIGDLMRYAALEAGLGEYQQFGQFRPFGELPDPARLSRLSDAQLYALALYLYSLKPPANPNRLDAVAKRGQKIFEREGCAECHPAPLYTANRPIPATDIGTDSRLALRTRVGTGSYIVPSLKGIWYREPLEHNGSLAMLEDWFDPTRVRDNYVPTGFKGDGVEARPLKGHLFGMRLSFDDRRTLMAFLRTL
jgi:cytochrome c553